MKIMLAIMEHDYGDVTRGPSYEFINFYSVLLADGHDILIFDYMTEFRSLGRDEMNAALVQRAAAFKPDVAIFSLYTDQIKPETIESLNLFTTTFSFFHDDTWRIEFSRFWASKFHFFSSADPDADQRYAQLGIDRLYYFPFGANTAVFKPSGAPRDIDVSFVGAWHPYRGWLINRLRRRGFRVITAGHGWPEGSVTHEQMVDIFNRTRVNLNLSNSASWDARYLLRSPRGALSKIRAKKTREQIKARQFEINACGAFQLSYYVNGLERCYEIGSEIGVYLDPDDLVDRVGLYLDNGELRERIAAKALQRTLADHSYSARFKGLFNHMGMKDMHG